MSFLARGVKAWRHLRPAAKVASTSPEPSRERAVSFAERELVLHRRGSGLARAVVQRVEIVDELVVAHHLVVEIVAARHVELGFENRLSLARQLSDHPARAVIDECVAVAEA